MARARQRAARGPNRVMGLDEGANRRNMTRTSRHKLTGRSGNTDDLRRSSIAFRSTERDYDGVVMGRKEGRSGARRNAWMDWTIYSRGEKASTLFEAGAGRDSISRWGEGAMRAWERLQHRRG